MTTQKYTSGVAVGTYRGGTGRVSCPPHSPILVEASGEGYYVARCLACGLRGPEREGDREGKVAFDESVAQSGWQPYSPECVEEEFCELRVDGVLGSWHPAPLESLMRSLRVGSEPRRRMRGTLTEGEQALHLGKKPTMPRGVLFLWQGLRFFAWGCCSPC